MASDTERTSRLNANTLIPLSATFAIIVSLASGLWWIKDQFTEIKVQFVEVKAQVSQVNLKIDAMSKDRWTSQDMTIWELEARSKNPTLGIPSVKEILRNRN